MSKAVIETPHGKVIVTKRGTAQLRWNPNFVPKWHLKYSKAQMFMDSEVLRRCEPYTPMLTGSLIKSGILGTTIGSGKVSWIAPYARRQYYMGRLPGTSLQGPLRGRLWFERMKATWKAMLIAGARKLIGKS